MSLGTEFFFSRKNNRPVRPSITTGQTRKVVNSNEKIMSFGVALMTIFLLTRQIYRTIELADGWYGYILRTEVYFGKRALVVPPPFRYPTVIDRLASRPFQILLT